MRKWYQKDKNEKRLCKCGCGIEILRWQKNLKERFYVYNHQPRNKPESYREYHKRQWLGEKNPMWKGGKTVKQRNEGRRVYPKQFDYISKELKKNKLCEICGNKAQNVHHTDGNTYNNDFKNLKVLCRSCHTKAHLKY